MSTNYKLARKSTSVPIIQEAVTAASDYLFKGRLCCNVLWRVTVPMNERLPGVLLL